MKLVDLSKKTIKNLQDAGEKGINNIELAEKLQMPRRRVYDIIATLRAAGLVELKRDKGGTRLFWATIPSIDSVTAPEEVPKELEKLKKRIADLEHENEDLKEKIKRIRDEKSKTSIEKTSEKKKFDSNGVIIRADKSLKIAEVVSSGIEVTIKATGKGIIVEPFSED